MPTFFRAAFFSLSLGLVDARPPGACVSPNGKTSDGRSYIQRHAARNWPSPGHAARLSAELHFVATASPLANALALSAAGPACGLTPGNFPAPGSAGLALPFNGHGKYGPKAGMLQAEALPFSRPARPGGRSSARISSSVRQGVQNCRMFEQSTHNH